MIYIRNSGELRKSGFMLIFFIYLIATAIGIIVFLALGNSNMLMEIFAADVTATLFVWLMGLILGNASVYDPYWSIAPILMVPLTAAYLRIWNVGTLLLISVIVLWGVRLTANWAFTFKGLNTQDWRYTQLKEMHPKLWFFINLLGICFFPTIIVFMVLVPAFLFITSFKILNAGVAFSAFICFFAIFLQALSDNQMRKFKRSATNAGHVNRAGLWKYIRHPNYLGEILMWWGIYLMLFSIRPDLWFALVGPLANTIMFICISIPLMENRQLKNKPDYADYKISTGMLLPRFLHNRRLNMDTTKS